MHLDAFDTVGDNQFEPIANYVFRLGKNCKELLQPTCVPGCGFDCQAKAVHILRPRADVPEFGEILQSEKHCVLIAMKGSKGNASRATGGMTGLYGAKQNIFCIHQNAHLPYQRSGYMLARLMASSERGGVCGKLFTHASNSSSHVSRESWFDGEVSNCNGAAWSTSCLSHCSTDRPLAWASAW